MAYEKKVKVIDYEAAWKDLDCILRANCQVLVDASLSAASFDFVVGKLTAYDRVLNMMLNLEGLYEEAK